MHDAEAGAIHPLASGARDLQVAPLALVLAVLRACRSLVVIVVSFFDYERSGSSRPSPSTTTSTCSLRRRCGSTQTLKFAADRLADHARARLHHRLFPGVPRPQPADRRSALFLLCTVPFWTSNIIRMISWIPFLGRNGSSTSA